MEIHRRGLPRPPFSLCVPPFSLVLDRVGFEIRLRAIVMLRYPNNPYRLGL